MILSRCSMGTLPSLNDRSKLSNEWGERGALLGNSLIVVDGFICTSDNHGNANFERIANPQQSRHCNRATRFNLLPMASGESECDHILLAVPALLAEFLDSLAQSFEEFGVIDHAASFTFS